MRFLMRVGFLFFICGAVLATLSKLSLINSSDPIQCILALFVLVTPIILVKKLFIFLSCRGGRGSFHDDTLDATDLIWYPRGIDVDDPFVEDLRGE